MKTSSKPRMTDPKNKDLLLEPVQAIIDTATEKYREGAWVTWKDRIPRTDDYPMTTNEWWGVHDVTCVYIDMRGSTQLSVEKQDKAMAAIYQYFTGTAVRILNEFDAAYIDVRGDGAFGLFDSNRLYHALAAAVTFKTLVATVIGKQVKLPPDISMDRISCHIGMDRYQLLAHRVGVQTREGKVDKHNEVWAGKPVNVAAKLASFGGENDLLISPRVYNIFQAQGHKEVLKSCGCNSLTKERADLWEPKDVRSDPPVFDFDLAARLISPWWCEKHGREYCTKILDYDK